jgi:hypothetical protein
MIKNDSINCFRNFFSPEINNFHKTMAEQYLYKAIYYKSDKIVKYIIKNKYAKINIFIIKIALLNRYSIPKLFELHSKIF